MIIDSDVLVWYLKGDKNAFDVIENQWRFSVSVVSYMDVAQGVRNKRELLTLRKALKNWGADVVYVDDAIQTQAMSIVEGTGADESVQVSDALIAATAITSGNSLLTGCTHFYKHISNLNILEFRPNI